jgi:hypothetical protein
VAGSGRADSVAAIRLVAPGRTGHSREATVLWASRANYLPLQLDLGQRPGTNAAMGYLIDVRWLPATAANLAKTYILPPPAEFRRVGQPRHQLTAAPVGFRQGLDETGSSA